MFLLVLLSLQRPPAVHVDSGAAQRAAVTGTYELRRGHDAGCWLQAAPVGRDSVRVQIACSRGAPSYNSGFLEQRLAWRAGAATFTTSEFGAPCSIHIRFRAASAVVQQQGSDAACGFGYGVYADGTYTRRSRRLPPFDLTPDG